MPAVEPVAIVGMGCRFPGGVKSPDDLWKLLAEGRDAVVEVPKDRWHLPAIYHPDPAKPGRMNTRRGGFLDQIDRFDAQFFGISPREAARMDPQQRLLLEVAYQAVEDAGLTMASLAGQASGRVRRNLHLGLQLPADQVGGTRSSRCIHQHRHCALHRGQPHLLFLQSHRPQSRRRHRVLVLARGDASGVPEHLERRERAGVRRRREPDVAARGHHRVLQGVDAFA